SNLIFEMLSAFFGGDTGVESGGHLPPPLSNSITLIVGPLKQVCSRDPSTLSISRNSAALSIDFACSGASLAQLSATASTHLLACRIGFAISSLPSLVEMRA